jgi:hypothetical protein
MSRAIASLVVSGRFPTDHQVGVSSRACHPAVGLVGLCTEASPAPRSFHASSRTCGTFYKRDRTRDHPLVDQRPCELCPIKARRSVAHVGAIWLDTPLPVGAAARTRAVGSMATAIMTALFTGAVRSVVTAILAAAATGTVGLVIAAVPSAARATAVRFVFAAPLVFHDALLCDLSRCKMLNANFKPAQRSRS